MDALSLAARIGRFLERLNGVSLITPPAPGRVVSLVIKDARGAAYRVEVRPHG